MGNLLFIPSLLAHDMSAFYTKLGIVVLLWLVVIGSSLVDLICGIQASKRLGTKHTTSWGLRKTLNKDLQYMGVLAALLFIDFATSALSPYITIFEVPILSIVGVIAITIIEGLSVRENIHRGRGDSECHLKDAEHIASELIRVFGDERAKEMVKVVQGVLEKQDRNDKHQ